MLDVIEDNRNELKPKLPKYLEETVISLLKTKKVAISMLVLLIKIKLKA